MAPPKSPPPGISKDSEPFFQPTSHPGTLSPDKRTGPDIDTASQWSAGKLSSDGHRQEKRTSERTGPDTDAPQHQSAGKLQSDGDGPRASSTRRTGPEYMAKRQSTGKPISDQNPPNSLHSDSDPAVSQGFSSSKLPTDQRSSHRPGTSGIAGSESPPLKASPRDSISSLESLANSDCSDRPPVELFPDEGELSEDQDFCESEEQTSEEQTYRETMSPPRSGYVRS